MQEVMHWLLGVVYTQKYSKENAIRKICDEGEMVKFNFIEDYLRGIEV